ncbi:MAG: DUF3052 domain-containing protein [Acidimicrobiales bacterium]
MAGYSGTPLVTKLGIEAGQTIALLDAPPGFVDQLEGLPDDVAIRTRAQGRNDVVVSFHTARAGFERRMPTLVRILDRDGGLWIAWPKKASRVPTDMTEDVVRAAALPIGLVDNKVCAVDDVWSALRVVWRRKLR